MGAFGSAFDTIIVGALALSWVLLVIHLFFSDKESRLGVILKWVEEQNQPALAGALLFAMAYPLGSAVSRIAQDFFDDDDLHVQVFGRLFQVGVTETSILADVYCRTLERAIPATKPAEPPLEKRETSKATGTTPTETKPSDPLTEKRKTFRTKDPDCAYTERWVVRQTHSGIIVSQDHQWISDQADLAHDIFHAQEAAVLLVGTDANERLRQFHDQIMVLRGAAFNGLVAFSLCLFWWSAKRQLWLRWLVPLAYFLPGAIALRNHFSERSVNDPPYMEFTLLVLAGAGWYLLWQGRPKGKGLPGTGQQEGIQLRHLVLPAFLTATAFLGWWATQRLYDQQVIYSYQAVREAPAPPIPYGPR